jgi:exonuclease SbcC
MKPVVLHIKAFGPFAGEEKIDFRELGTNPLFLINGPTGSGKSSILDAICFALYGETTGKERDPAQMRSDHALTRLQTEITLEFIILDRAYKIQRLPSQMVLKTKGEGTTKINSKAQLWYLDGSIEGKLLGNSITDVNEKVKELMGLGVEQFRQVMVLPQGKFRDLLMADSKTRESIFSQLFQTHIYKQIEEKLKAKSDEIKKQINSNQDTIKGVLKIVDLESVDLIDQERLELEPILVEATQKRDEALKNLNETKFLFEKSKIIKENFDQLKSKQLELEKLLLQEPIISVKKSTLFLAQKAETVRHSYENLIQAEEKIKSVTLDLKDCRNNLDTSKIQEKHSGVNVEKAKESANSLDKLNEELHSLKQQLKFNQELETIRTSIQSQVKDFSVKEKEFNEKKKNLEALKNEIDSKNNENLAYSTAPESLKDREYDIKIFSDTLIERKKLESLREDILTLNHQEKTLQKQLESKMEEEASARTNLLKAEKTWYLNRAALLAQELKENIPCPVCGSEDHPAPAVMPQDHENLTVEVLDNLRGTHSGLTTEVQKIQFSIESNLANVTRVSKEMEGLESKLSETASLSLDSLNQIQKEKQAEIQLLKTKIVTYRENLTILEKSGEKQKNLQKEMEECNSEVLVLKQTLAESNAKMEQIFQYLPEQNRDITIVQNKIKVLMGSIGSITDALKFAEEDYKIKKSTLDKLIAKEEELSKQTEEAEKNLFEFSGNWEKILKETEFLETANFKKYLIGMSAQEKLRSAIEEYTSLRDTLMGAVDQIREELKEKTVPDLKSIEDTVIQNNKIYLEFQTQLATQQERYNLLDNVRSKVSKLQEDQTKLHEKYGLYGTLSEVATGNSEEKISLQRFVLSVLLEDVLIQASHRLNMMSRGRYALVRKGERNKGNSASGLDLEVQDEYTGTTRGVATLSGGESFLAALSLALGLSDVVQSYSGGIKLDTLFIDEGFGSLDPESLELAVRTLIDLQATGRTIGIISHVTELKEQMALQVEVKSSKTGSTIKIHGTLN